MPKAAAQNYAEATSPREKMAFDTSAGPEQAALDVLNQLAVNHRDNTISIPIDVEALAQKMGLFIERKSLPEDIDGILVRANPYDPFKAVLDIHSSTKEARFTLAHEMGHYIHSYQNLPDNELGGVLEYRRHPNTKLNDEETWADRFAASLLMPSGIVALLWRQGKSISEMASTFVVSGEAVRRRVNELGLRE